MGCGINVVFYWKNVVCIGIKIDMQYMKDIGIYSIKILMKVVGI